MRTKLLAVAVIAMLATSAVGVAWAQDAPNPPGNEGHTVRFNCASAKTQALDPIIGTRGETSHDHVFVGNPRVKLASTGQSLQASGGTTCNVPFASSSWWFPVLSDDDGPMTVKKASPYYQGIGDQAAITAPPTGLEMIGSAKSNPATATRVMWGCGGKVDLAEPPTTCEAGKFVREKVYFQNCLRTGSELQWSGGGNLLFRPDGQACPEGYTQLPIHYIAIDWENPDGVNGELMVSAGHHGEEPASTHAHADVIEGNQEPEFGDLIERCITNHEDYAPSPSGCKVTGRG